MKAIFDWLWWLTGSSTWAWIVIILIAVALVLLALTYWCMCVLAKRSDEQSDELFQKNDARKRDEKPRFKLRRRKRNEIKVVH